MVWYILLVAVVNLGLGFAAAVCLARRYRELVALGSRPAERAAPSGVPASDRLTRPGLTPAVAGNPAAIQEPAVGANEWDEVIAPPADGLKSARAPSADGHWPDQPPADEELPPEQAQQEVAADPPREISPDEACVQDFKDQVEQYHQQLIHLHEALRGCDPDTDPAMVDSLADSLGKANQQYLASREPVHEDFQSLQAEREKPGVLSESLQAAIQRQNAGIENTKTVIEDLDREADPSERRQQILDQVAELLRANHSLRDTLEETSAGLARTEQRLKSVDGKQRTDTLTELANRTGLETTLAKWWGNDPHRVRQLNAVMIDVDEFGRLNEQVGHEVGDRILRALARLLTTETRSHASAARFSGQRFVLLFLDVDVRFAVDMVERIRQTVEMTHFECHGNDVRITVSCGVVEAAPDDTSETLCARAETTLQEAKRYGRNRTFVHEGKYPAPVVPPNFTLEENFVVV